MKKRAIIKRVSAWVLTAAMVVSGLPQIIRKDSGDYVYAQSESNVEGIDEEKADYYVVGGCTPGEWNQGSELNKMQETDIPGVYSIEFTVSAFDEEEKWNNQITVIGRTSEYVEENFRTKILLGRPDITVNVLEENTLEDFSKYYIKCKENTKVVVYFDENTHAIDIRDSEGNDVEYSIVWCEANAEDEEDYTPEEFSVLSYKEYKKSLNNSYLEEVLNKVDIASLPDFVLLEKQLEEKIDSNNISVKTISSIYGIDVQLVANPTYVTGDNIEYQWYFNDEIISGETQNQYQVTADYTTDYGYYCKISNGSEEEIIYYNIILDNILNLDYYSETTVLYGETEELCVEATSVMSSEIGYQWYKVMEVDYGGYTYIELEGETGNILLVEGDESLSGKYICVVSDGISSETAEFIIDTGLDIYYDSYVTVGYGKERELNIEATSEYGEIKYEWYKYWYNEDGDTLSVLLAGETKDTLTVTGNEDVGYKYECKVTDGITVKVTEIYVTLDTELTVNEDEHISVKYGENVTLTVTAESKSVNPIEYQWYVYSLETYEYETINDAISNEYNVVEAMTYTTYKCVVTDGVLEEEVYFHIIIDTELTVEYEEKVTVEYGTEKELKVSVTSLGGEIEYEWYKLYRDLSENVKRVKLEEEVSDTITITGNENVGYRYECRITDGINSEVVYIDVELDTGLTVSEDEYLSLTYGEEKELKVTAESRTGRTIGYNWYYYDYEERRYILIDGAHSNTITITPLTEKSAYRCGVTDRIKTEYVYFHITDVDTELKLEAETNVILEYGEEKELKVVANSKCKDNFTYQWFWYYYDEYDNSRYEALMGETKDTLTILGDETAGYEYCCRVSDGILTEWISIDVTVDTGLTAQCESNVLVKYGEEKELKVEATSNYGEISYQWYTTFYDAEGDYYYYDIIEGETKDTLIIQCNENTRCEYRCRVTDGINKIWKSFYVTVIEEEEVTYEWKHNENGWWYEGSDGSYPRNEWKYINGEWYHFNKYGYMQTGWYKEGDEYYYLGSSGAMQKSRWINNKYYVKADGTMAVSEFVDNGRYYVDETGAWVTLSKWIKVDGNWYYILKGTVQISKWTKVGTKYYYFDETGVMQANKWIQNKYYVKADGSMAVSEFVDNGRYYVDENGAWVTTTKWLKIGDNWYYILKGTVQISKWTKVGEKYYYFDDTGVMQTSKWINGTYYVKADGSMAVSEWVDGGKYYVGSDGKWVKGA
ncbi:MAG: hypothetical protein IJA34_10655 [Lachnospiraceae bacterium]|nr:hypothetical protein [Lachnospiraceae bacterium]